MLFASFAAGVAAFCFVRGILYQNQTLLEKRLQHLDSSQEVFITNTVSDDTSWVTKIIKPYLEQIAEVGMNVSEKFSIKEVENKLIWAGEPFNLTPEQFFGIKISLAILMPLLYVAYSFTLSLPLIKINNFILFIILVIGGYFLPDFWLKSKIDKRTKKIKKQLPSTLDILVVNSNAGLSFDDSIKRMVEKTQGLLSDEFKKALYEMNMGTSRKEALLKLAERSHVEDLTKFINAVLQAEEYGTPISKTLEAQSDALRNKLRNEAEEQASKAPVKLMLPLIIFVIPSILAILLGPAMGAVAKLFL